MKRFYSFLCSMLMIGIGSKAYAKTIYADVTCTDNGETIIVNYPFDVLSVDSTNNVGTVAIGGEGRSSLMGVGIAEQLVGEFQIPETIQHGDITYTVTAIGAYGFGFSTWYTANFTIVTIPQTVKTIEGGAFHSCSNLTTVNIPGSLEKINSSAFAGCSSLVNINIYDGEDEYYAENWDGMAIGARAFSGCTSLTNINELFQWTASIGDFAFMNCTGLTSIETEGMWNLGRNPFRGCSNLESINIITEGYEGNGYWVIEGSFLSKNPATGEPMNAIISPEGVLVTACKNTKNLAGAISKIGDYACAGLAELTSLEFPHSIASIGNNAFLGCSNLTSFVCPKGTYEICDSAFYGCDQLTTIDFSNVQKVGVRAFRACTSLPAAIFENECSVSQYAFQGCSALETVAFNGGLLGNLGVYAFGGCHSLNKVICNNLIPTTQTLARSPFANNVAPASRLDLSGATLYVPVGTTGNYADAAVWKTFGTIKEMKGFDLNVTSAGLATLYVDRPLEIPEDDDLLGVFYGTSTDGDVLKMRRVKDIIPANTGVIVMANEGTYTFPFHWTENEVTDNVISGVLEDTPKADVMSEKGYRQILTLGQGKTGSYIGFYKFTGTTLGANKAFIGLESEGSDEVKLQFEDGTETGIENLNVNDNAIANKGVYDLSGRRVNNPAKGLYIVNGKKVLF